MTLEFTNADVSAVVCTQNSISGVEQCLRSLKDVGVGQIIVVDAHSTDGTELVIKKYADLVLHDPGIGLGNARNIGISESTGSLVLNMGSDNVLPVGELEKMIAYLTTGEFAGVSAQTVISGNDYCSKGLNMWRQARFSEGVRPVIGTPTLFVGDLIRQYPFSPVARFSDDSELCERWSRELHSRFAISDAVFHEIGKSTWEEIKIRAKMYGVSDREIYSIKKRTWSNRRKVKSMLHPLRVDFLQPISRTPLPKIPYYTPFFAKFTWYRYKGWIGSR